jgi:polyketide biosynthesis 3-hydroxy-3-methylglutaryl-CoA synthase-like enzyme PksG
MGIEQMLDNRYELTMEEYDNLLIGSNALRFGTRNLELDTSFIPQARAAQNKPVLFLKKINEFHREYEWVG